LSLLWVNYESLLLYEDQIQNSLLYHPFIGEYTRCESTNIQSSSSNYSCPFNSETILALTCSAFYPAMCAICTVLTTESGCPYFGALNLHFLILLELHWVGKMFDYVDKIAIGSWLPYFIIAMHLFSLPLQN
jgi:hypothetical protein